MGIFMKPTDPPFSDYEQEIGKSAGAHAAFILWKVRLDLGVLLHEIHTGGGCYALEGRLETCHWIVATDLDCNSLRSRLGFEWFGPPMGWCIGIYRDGEEYSSDGWWLGEEAVLQVVDHSAEGWQLHQVMEVALRQLASRPRSRGSGNE